MSNDKSLEVYVAILQEENLVAQFLTSKMTRKIARNRMNENSEIWQCANVKISGVFRWSIENSKTIRTKKF